MKRRQIAVGFSALLVIILMAWVISCAVNPVTGKRELMLLSEADEISLGQQTDQEIVQTYGVYEDAALNAYVNNLGQRIAAITHRPNLPYTFKVLDTPVVNAFAVPGGYVYLTRGILAYMNNEAELAGVIGHELGHVNMRHSAQQYTQQSLASLGLGVGLILSEKMRQYSDLAQFGVQMLFLSFSRADEREADDLGVDYSLKSGYDSNGMASFFVTLERMNPASGGASLPEWFSTHPNPDNRIQAVIDRTAKKKKEMAGTNFAINESEYLAKLNGLIFGDDPRQGYVDGNAFYHPAMKFSFPVPSGWTVNNTPAQVQMISNQQDAVIIFGLSGGTNSAEAARAFVSESGVTVKQLDAVSINSLTAHRLVASLQNESQALGFQSFFIEKDNNIYVFHGYTTEPQFSGYQTTFERTMRSFTTLTDANRINVSPTKLIVKKTQRTGTARTVLQSLGVAQADLESAALMNGLTLDQQVPVGRMIKVTSK